MARAYPPPPRIPSQYKIGFGLADRGIAKEIYRFMFGQPESNVAKISQQEGYDEEVDRQADVFAAKLPESEFSPAEIMAYLLRHWHSPVAAIEHCDQWADDLLQEKKTKKEA